ncbi:Scn11a [Symbiodinium natans]|uniref:Scn11a protein n=1 Tax=Symbiodinium natans TaxID=878477 RepID=A0A812P0G5_9DINO|nr:Scn11a [Symbiodinium natans]
MAAADREQMVVEMLREKDKLMKEFQHCFDEMDTNGSGEIEFEELEELLENPGMQAYLSHLHISTSGAWNIFKLLDKDETGSVSLPEFVEGLLSLKGLSKTVDIAALQYDVKKMNVVLRDFMEYVESEFTKLGQLLPDKSSEKSMGDNALDMDM